MHVISYYFILIIKFLKYNEKSNKSTWWGESRIWILVSNDFDYLKTKFYPGEHTSKVVEKELHVIR